LSHLRLEANWETEGVKKSTKRRLSEELTIAIKAE